MPKKILIIFISIILIILFITFVIINKKSNKIKVNNEVESEENNPKVESNYDENTSLYYVKDIQTGEIVGASRDEADLKFYEENPDYNPNPLQQRSLDMSDYIYEITE